MFMDSSRSITNCSHRFVNLVETCCAKYRITLTANINIIQLLKSEIQQLRRDKDELEQASMASSGSVSEVNILVTV